MHIAFLTPEYPYCKIKHAAGIGTSIKNLAQALVKKEHTVSVFIYGQDINEVIEDNGVKLHLIKDIQYSYFKWFRYRKHIQKHIQTIITTEKIDILEAPDWTGITAFMSFNIPLIIRFHGSDTYFCHIENRTQKRKNFWFEKLATKKAVAFIAPTTYAGEVSKKLFEIENKEIKTIHYGLELEFFSNDTPLIYEKESLLYIGTIIRKKGVLEFPEIIRRVWDSFPEVTLTLIGADAFDIKTQSPSTWQLLKNQFTTQELEKIKYIGKIPYQEVQNYIKKSHICVFPTYAETLGMVTIESMALQKPVVNSNIGWAQELIVDGESGFLVHPSHYDLYASRIAELIRDSTLSTEMSEKARLRVESHFDIHTNVIYNLDFYSKYLK